MKVSKPEFVRCFMILSPLYFGLSRHLQNHGYWADQRWEAHVKNIRNSLLFCCTQMVYVKVCRWLSRNWKGAKRSCDERNLWCFWLHQRKKWYYEAKPYLFFLQTLKNIGFHTLQNIFDALLNEQACFYRIYMKLLGIKHVQSLRKLCIYFFPFGMMNYARMTLVYLS